MQISDTLSGSHTTLDIGRTVRLYSCGPTVYNKAHIGNLRSFIFPDTLRRTLEFQGHEVDWVMNITDVDDKTIKGTIAEFGVGATVENLRTFTDKYLGLFLEDLKQLNIDTTKIRFIRVADVIPQIQDFILKLRDKGYAYQAEDGSWYFSIEKYQNDFGDYGALVGQDFLEGKKVGARVKVDEYDKENLSDFALWKAHTGEDAEIYWEHTTLGKGRPGWHIECSVINDVAFGSKTTDIHTGGVDLIFPHHTNEIAQSQPIYKPFVKHWAHSEHLLVDGKKMAKREGNFYVLQDLVEKAGPSAPMAFRYLCLQSNFNTQLNFTWDSLLAAKSGMENLSTKTSTDSDVPLDEFKHALEQDLSTAKALGVAHSSAHFPKAVLEQVLGLSFDMLVTEQALEIQEAPQNIQELLKIREEARQNKDFALSDQIRQQIAALGYEVLDTPEGQKVKKSQ